MDDTMESYTRADNWSAPQQRRARCVSSLTMTVADRYWKS
ncbi:hypothetical protein [Enterobacter hormaechei]